MKRPRAKWFLASTVVALVCGWIMFGRSPGARISGKVVLRGTPRPKIVVQLDPESAKLHPNGLTTRHYVVAPDGGLANVFVYVRNGLEGQSFPPAKGAAVVEFRHCLIEPYVSGVRTNQPVKFRNRDPILQNVHCMTKVPGNKEFTSALIPIKTAFRLAFSELWKGRWPWRTPTTERHFPSPEIFIRVKCDVHPWEFGYLAVVEHPFFAVTGKDGSFHLPPGLPAGKYIIEARHLKAGVATQEITLLPGEKKRIDFTLEVKP
jgi:hypothetical protein